MGTQEACDEKTIYTEECGEFIVHPASNSKVDSTRNRTYGGTLGTARRDGLRWRSLAVRGRLVGAAWPVRCRRRARRGDCGLSSRAMETNR